MSKVVPLQLNYYYECRFQNFSDGEGKVKLKKAQLQWPANDMKSKSQKYLVRNQSAAKPATYSTTMSTDIPLYETPGALYDDYLEDRHRAFSAMFPEKHSIQQLNQDEWRVKMIPFKILAKNVWPMVDFRLGCKSNGRDYPPEVPQDITTVLELHTTRWELQGIDNIFDPSYFTLAVRGTLYPDRRGNKSRIRGDSEMSISIVYPPAFNLIPDGIRDSLAQGVMAEVAKRMSQNVEGSLLADYTKFKKERSNIKRKNTVALKKED
ncbi:hypothetical protein HRI_003491000 [Hibiscus trionum]|uniref:DUF1997 domain-containing protein n=1 Tax=Hibiscus trionum TaxID=183268 RepID=A0A9W7IKB4_HIBTR|nr:hypothetical protein HRI_003491000 [Hibiscus trionum]